MPDGRSPQVEQNGGAQKGGEPAATAPEGPLLKGLKVPRRFTRTGVHPYDDIEWERRTASIVSRGGKVSFEQAEVEFPASWSQNATNIVAEKYFRGKQGSPEREWSVRQIIDRVVDTITAWGVEQGRFTAEEDRDAFNAELKHILVTQKASFNSPVWFNIGVRGRAQQASACQPYDALVSTPSGLVPIGRLVEDDAVGTKVFDHAGATKILATKMNGTKRVLRIHTKSGHRLDVTPDHLVWRSSRSAEAGRFVEAGTLNPGDSLVCIPSTSFEDGQTYLVGPPEMVAIDRIEDLGEMPVYDIQTESGEYLSNGIRVHNCFILHVDDSMDSIAEWYRDEMFIFKGGSGSGVNVSNLRSSYEQLAIGGYSSGPVSFMRGADAAAGTIKSGGATRRAAKMVVFNVDHPDLVELRDGSPGFIWCKAVEERKARALKQAGFDMSVDSGVDAYSLQYQNANNSVRFTDEFMQAYLEDREWHLRAVTTGDVIKTWQSRDLMQQISQAAWECADPGAQYHTTINDWHTAPAAGPITASNPCSEYLHVDNSPCNLASLNLLKFLRPDHSFNVEDFEHTVATVLLGQAILAVAADYPTEKIARNARGFRELGIGYANLGALLMALGVSYDSDEGRAWAATVTALMQAASYRASARFAQVVGPYPGTDELPGYSHPENRDATVRVLRKHAAYAKAIAGEVTDEVRRLDKRLDTFVEEVVGGGEPATGDTELARVLARANEVWEECLALAERHGVENSQVSVLAPTGCLVGGTLVPTERGLVRLASLGDPAGERWQPLEVGVMTDEGRKQATRFFVNGLSPVVRVSTDKGHRIVGTPEHRVRVADPSGEWRWKRLAEIEAGDTVPLAAGQLLGSPQEVLLPALPDGHSSEPLKAPARMTPDLAELVGYFAGDDYMDAESIRLWVGAEDFDVAEYLQRLGKNLFGLQAHLEPREGGAEVVFRSARLALWWRACGFSDAPTPGDPEERGLLRSVPDAVLAANDRDTYAAFCRGLFEAAGSVRYGSPELNTISLQLAEETQSLLLALGYPSERGVDTSGWAGALSVSWVRLGAEAAHRAWGDEVGFISAAKNAGIQDGDGDKAPLHGFVTDEVATAELGGEELTYDLSVPENVTYVANGFVSHNTIGFMMDCDTTGVEPDLALKKVKKLVGGGTMTIVNQTVPRALRRLGYNDEQIEAIVAFIDENNTVVGAPALRPEHYPVFACSFTTDNLISYMGHVKMIAAVQPSLSGGVSKTINVPEDAPVEEIEKIYTEGWRLGLKALSVYRDNCKADQPLSAEKKEKAEGLVSVEPAQPGPVRRRLPKRRPSVTYSFRVADCDGYAHVGLYPDTKQPGEIFIKVAKQGSTLAGVMDAFAISVSMGLQYGVPLETYVEKFMNMTFEPRGITDDPDVRFAASLMDFIFRKLALEFLPADKREALGIRTLEEREQYVNGMNTPPTIEKVEEAEDSDMPEEFKPASSAETLRAPAVDAPLCTTCGVRMRPSGNCFACESCGSTSGCS